jgi:hypothetical protein
MSYNSKMQCPDLYESTSLDYAFFYEEKKAGKWARKEEIRLDNCKPIFYLTEGKRKRICDLIKDLL